MDRLGAVRQEDLEQSFANAAFALEPNQLSYVVKSNRGFHIILRE
jgi:parvulin-like peptidyl-prolyl isomerase